jgi:hypothetical protein
MTVAETFHKDIVPKIDKSVRTFVVGVMYHDGSAEVTMKGEQLDMVWISKLAEIRLNQVLASKEDKKP